MFFFGESGQDGFVANLRWTQLPLVAVGTSVAVWLLRALYTLFLSPLKDIPGPFLARYTRLWELRQMIRGDSHETLVKLHEKHGKHFQAAPPPHNLTIHTGPVVRISPNLYSFNSLEDQKKIYSLKADFVKTPYYSTNGNPYRPNWFSMSDEIEHADRKKRLAYLYSMSSMINYEPAVDRMNAVCMQKFEEFAMRGTKVLVPEFMQCYAFDVIGEITVDQGFGMMNAEGDVDDLIHMVQSAVKYQGTVGIFPEWHIPIFHVANLLGIRNAGTMIGELGKKRLDAHRDDSVRVLKHDPKTESFITKLLQLEAAGKVGFGNQMDAIGGNIAAGSDTTAITLSAALYYLYQDPRVLQALRDEVTGFAAEGKISDPVKFAEAQAMPYLQAVIMETLRLHPAVGYLLPRVVPKGGAILAGRFFPEGTEVGVSAWALHSNPEIYGSDAREFKPERFLKGSNLDNSLSASQLGSSFAFGAGTRTCIGKNISLLEITKVLPQIVRRFDLEMADDQPWELFTSWFVWQKYYCHIKLREV